MLRGLFLIILPFIGAACCKGKCLDDYLQLNFIGFQNTDVDTIIVKSFKKGSDFLMPLGTREQYLQQPPGDTLFFYIHDAPPSMDYEIIVPSTLDSFRIANISTRRRDCNCGSDWKEVTSFTLNETRIDANTIVLRR